jgi:hypothetical protein
MRNDRLFDENKKANRIAFLTIYVPILRYTVNLFIIGYNGYNIRKQKDIPRHVSGIPEILYSYLELSETEDYSITLNTNYLRI